MKLNRSSGRRSTRRRKRKHVSPFRSLESQSLTFEPLEDRRVLAAWVSAGPSPMVNGGTEKLDPNNETIGATHALLAHPTDSDILYLGSVNGGVWRTDNATSASPHWVPLTDGASSQSIGALAIDPSNPDRILAGIGQYSAFADGGELTGLLLTTDGGQTWTEIFDPMFTDKNFSGVAIHGDTLIASAGGGFFRDDLLGQATPDRGGLFRSTDGGQTWTSLELLDRDPANEDEPAPFEAFDLVSDPSDVDRYYVAIGNQGIFLSEDAGETWENVASGDLSDAITISDPNAPTENNNTEMAVGQDGRIYVAVLRDGQPVNISYSDDQGSGWTTMDLPQTPEADGTVSGLSPRPKPGGQGAIHFSIVVDPSDSSIVYVGGDRQDGLINFPTGNFIGARGFTGRLFRGDASIEATGAVPSPQWAHLTHSNRIAAIPDGGTATGSAPHADSREMVFLANGDLVQGDDGGIYRRTDPQDNTGDWFSMVGDAAITEIHNIAYDSNSNILIAGAQDNSSIEQIATGAMTWQPVNVIDLGAPFRFGGDGGDVAVDDTSMPGFSFRYSSAQFLGGFRRQQFDSNNQLIEQTFIAPPSPIINFVTPIFLNDLDQQRLIVAASDGAFYESFDRGDTFAPIFGLGFPSIEFSQNNMVYGGAIGAEENPDLIWAGSFDEVFLRENLEDDLVLTRAQYPGKNIVDLIADTNDWKTLYVADSDSIYVTRNAGRSWSTVTGDLGTLDPGSLRKLEYVQGSDSDKLIVGTNRGVHVMDTDIPGSWTTLGTDLPNVPVYDMDYDRADDVLVVGSFGRGAWMLYDATDELGITTESGSATTPYRITGTKWVDLNGDGVRDTGDVGIGGQTIYVDYDGDGRKDPGEPSAMTANDGSYSIGVFPGTYKVAEVVQDGWEQTFPGGKGTHKVTVKSGGSANGVDFGNQRVDLLYGSDVINPDGGSGGGGGIITPPRGATIVGRVYDDINGDREFTAGEPGVEGIVVFVDANNDHILGVGEAFDETDADGKYAVDGLSAGTHRVRMAVHPGRIQDDDSSEGILVLIDSNTGTVQGPDFATTRNFDYGNLPYPYNTTEAMGGPVHGYVPGFHLGDIVLGEDDGQPGESPVDNDGVAFISGLHPGRQETLFVNASQLSVSRGYLHAWIDFDGDGTLEDSEKIFSGQRLLDGDNGLTFTVPATATTGEVGARFRWVYEKTLGPDGPAFGGEVEDYMVTIPMDADTGLKAVDDFPTVLEDSILNEIDVLANDIPGLLGDTMTITQVSTPSEGGTAIIDNDQVLYTPVTDFFGEETFTYTIVDDAGGSSQATVTVTVENVNDNPVANPDEFTVGAESQDNVLDVLANDTSDPDLGETLIITNVSATSHGGTVIITPNQLELRYTPATGFEGTETFTYTISDQHGGFDSALVTVTVVELADIVAFDLIPTDLAGNPISSISITQEFLLEVRARDLRDVPAGVFSGYLDVMYDFNLVSTNGDIDFNDPTYPFGHSGDTTIGGLVDEAGAVDGGAVAPTADEWLLTVPMRADAAGTFTFWSDPADILPLHEVTLVDGGTAVPPANIDYGTATFEVLEVGANDDFFTVDEDSVDNPLDVLANDHNVHPLEITTVSTPDSGGSVEIVNGGTLLHYTPLANFYGVEVFTYTIANAPAGLDQATVEVTVTPINDNPTANDDFYTINEGAIDFPLNVLENDETAPDGDETLTITAVSDPDNGTAVNDGGTRVLYTPDIGFVGVDTFTYDITDGNGGSDQATVQVTVVEVPDLVEFSFTLTDVDDNPLGALVQGQDFVLNIFAEELTVEKNVVFSAYLDVTYDASLADVNGALEFAGLYPFGHSGDTSVGGLIDEVGAVDGISATPAGGPARIVSLPMTATGVGDVTFAGDPADILPAHEVALFGIDGAVPASSLRFVPLTVNIAGPSAAFTNWTNPADVNGDNAISPVDVLMVINQLDQQGARDLSDEADLMMIDVNGDGFLSPVDALLVINALDHLNSPVAGTPAAAMSQTVSAVASDNSSQVADSGLATTVAATARQQAFATPSKSRLGIRAKSVVAEKPPTAELLDAALADPQVITAPAIYSHGHFADDSTGKDANQQHDLLALAADVANIWGSGHEFGA